MALLKTFPLDPDAGYGFEWLRAMLEVSPLQEGVVGAGDYKVTPAAAGGNRVDVAAGWALVKGDSGLPALGLTQGLYLQGNDAGIANAVTFDPGGANPRLDQVVLTVADTSDLGTAGNAPALAIVKGAEGAGTTLDNRTGAGALPANSIRIADRLVPAGASTVNVADVRDRRPWARGALRRVDMTASGADYVVTTATMALLDSAIRPRIECSGRELICRVTGSVGSPASGTGLFRFYLDAIDQNSGESSVSLNASTSIVPLVHEAEMTPAVGSHLVDLMASSSAGAGMRVYARATLRLHLLIYEDLRPSADNT